MLLKSYFLKQFYSFNSKEIFIGWVERLQEIYKIKIRRVKSDHIRLLIFVERDL